MSQQDDNQEQSFNDAELQDIMNEIESLEREFVEEESDTPAETQASEEVAEATVSETPVETEVSEEPIETQSVETEDIVEHSEEEEATSLIDDVSTNDYEDNVVSIGERRDSATSHSDVETPGQMQFSGTGTMDFNLNFLVGDSNAEVVVKEGKLQVTMAGVELTLSENGCEVSMEGGVKFSVPISSATAAKKAA